MLNLTVFDKGLGKKLLQNLLINLTCTTQQ